MDPLSLLPPFVAADPFAWIALPLLIFLARVIDVSMGTIRVILISRGVRRAALIGFFEVLIWLVAITQIMARLSNPLSASHLVLLYVAYACGYSSGTYVGIRIEERLSIGLVMVQVVTGKDASELIAYLERAHVGVTSLDGEGSQGPVKVIFTIIKREDLEEVVAQVKRFDPHAFYSVGDVRSVGEGAGVFPSHRAGERQRLLALFRSQRQGK